jgi:HAD superfamily hydrolase (TIGR01509 family)
MNESMFDMLKKVEIFLKNSGKSGRSVSKIRKDVWDLAEKYELEAAKTASLLPGVTEALEELKKMHLKLGLFTTNSEKTVKYILERFELTRFFGAVTPRDKVKNVKPNPEHFKTTLKGLHVKPEETVLVDNDQQDLLAAKELNVNTVEFSAELSSSKELASCGGDYFLDSISDVPKLVKKINSFSRTKRKGGRRNHARAL